MASAYEEKEENQFQDPPFTQPENRMIAANFSNQTLIPSLPNDISIDILARVPRSQHPYLSLVSKGFRSLTSSTLLLTTRSLINSTETSLFITICPYDDPSTRHFFILRNRRLVPLPPNPCCRVGSAYATIGPCIYVLGGCLSNGIASADVWIFDCRSRKWAAGTPMHVARQRPMAGVVDGKLYVMGGCGEKVSAEVYDPDRGSWELVEGFPEWRMKEMDAYGSTVLGRKIYAMTFIGVLAYDFRTRIWEYMVEIIGSGSCCILDGVLYWCDFYKIKGFDLKERNWKAVTGTGLEGNLWYNVGNMQLANFEGKLVAFWEQRKNDKDLDWEVRCMEIEIDEKKGKNEELRGNVCFNESAFTFPYRCRLINCLAVAF